MTKKRAANLKNYAAIRRKSRRVERARAQDAVQARTRPIPAQGLTLVGCHFQDNGADVRNEGGQITSYGSHFGSDIGVVNLNGGQFDSHGDTFGPGSSSGSSVTPNSEP